MLDVADLDHLRNQWPFKYMLYVVQARAKHSIKRGQLLGYTPDTHGRADNVYPLPAQARSIHRLRFGPTLTALRAARKGQMVYVLVQV